MPTSYQVTAVDGKLDIQIVNGVRLGRGLALDATNTVETLYQTDSGNICTLDGVDEEYSFDYTFTFKTNGTGSASAKWSYGANAHCAVCQLSDSATLQRTAGPP